MPYSKAWRSAMYPDYKEQGAYVDYKATKEILHRMKENISNPATPDELYASLTSQKKYVYAWCKRKVAELKMAAEALHQVTIQHRVVAEEELEGKKEFPEVEEENNEVGALGASLSTSKATSHNCLQQAINLVGMEARGGEEQQSSQSILSDGLQSSQRGQSRASSQKIRAKDVALMADAITYELLRYVECKNLNTDTIEHIVGRMYRYAVLGPTGERWHKIYTENDYDSISVDEIFYLLSCIYDCVKTCKDQLFMATAHHTPCAGAVGSQQFDRRSVKYWVHLQDLPFVVARIIPHLPLSTFTNTYAESRRRGVPFTLFSPVSSVYWDNPQFLFYHRRLERVEGSTIIRMRWYSNPLAEDPNSLQPDDPVYMEIKVHHEAWSGDRSNKRRFKLKNGEVDDFIAGNLSLIGALDKMRQGGATIKQQSDFQSLATEILSKVHAYGLKPAIRTQCGRAAFQRGSDQSVRVSIDTNLRFSAEDFGLAHHWRYEGNDAPSSSFPYAVVEVKLQCAENERIAPWIEELMTCRYMESIPKFSKYSHGIATLYGHTTFIHMVPYWMHQLHIDIRASTKPELHQWDPTVGLASGCIERAVDRAVFGTSAGQTQNVGASEAQFLYRNCYARVYQLLLQQLRSATNGSPPREGEDSLVLRTNNSKKVEEVLQKIPVIQYSVDHRHRAYTNFHLFPYVENGVESLCFKLPSRDTNSSAKVAFGVIPWQIGKRIRVPQKYDPKTLLTAERYMVKWAQFGTAMGFLGIAIIQFGQGLRLPTALEAWAPFWTPRFHTSLGLILVLLGLATLGYAYAAFRARCRRVYARRKVRFDHPSGPTGLTRALVFTFLALGSTYVINRYAPMLTQSDAF